MAPKKKSNGRQSQFLSLSSKSRQEFIQEYNKYDEPKKRELFCKISREIEIFISQGNLDQYKKLNKLLIYIAEIVDKTILEEYEKDENNPLRNTNLVILACKYNQVDILNHILDVEKNNASITPNATDDANHNGFYYAIRSNNTNLLDMLVDRWPGNYFADDPQALDDILSQAYEELKLKNVPLSEEMEFFVESKLINLRFFSESQKKHKAAPVDLKTIIERIELVIENIHLLREEYLNIEEMDEKFFFIATFIAQNIHILKRQLKSTYDRLPWEEIEFCLVCYISSHTKQEEINLFYRTTLNKTKMLSYLQHFAQKLEQEKSVIWKLENTGNLTDLPFMKREKVVTNITKKNPQFKELYNDYHSIRDIHSLQKINDYIKLALSANPKEKEGQLIITRVLQVIGEYFKNTLESPKLSVTTSELLLLSLPKNTRKIVVDLRNSLSHAYAFSKRTEIQEYANSNFFNGIQNDTKKNGDGITSILFDYKLRTIRYLLNKIIDSESVNDVKEVTDILGNVKLDLTLPVNFVSSDHEKLKTLTLELKKCISMKKNYVLSLFNEIDILLTECSGGTPEFNILQSFAEGFTSLVVFKTILRDHIVDSNAIKFMKLSAARTLKNISPPKIKPDNMREIARLVMKIYVYVKVGEESNDVVDQVIRLILEIVYLTELENSDIKLIQELRDKLVKNIPYELLREQKLAYKAKDDDYNKLLTLKLSDLNDIMKNNGLTNNIMKHISAYKADEKLQAAVEMLVLDIMSIFGMSKKYLENNFLFLDSSTPLLTGKSLRNHLAHDNNLIDILLPNPTVAVIVNAKKLTTGQIMNENKKMGKLVKDDPIKLREKFNMRMITVLNQRDLFVALQEGQCEEVKRLVVAGADMNARSISLGWTTLHFACKGPSLECVKLVIDHKIDIKVKDINGHTPYLIAAEHGRTKIVKFFLEEKDMSVDYQNNNGLTALHLAARSGHLDVVEVLLRNGASTQIQDETGNPPLLFAIANTHVDVAKILWKKDCDVETKGGFKPLHKAADIGHTELVNYLLDNNADVNSKNDNDYTPLHAAAFNGHHESIKTLVLKGADVNASLINGCTPLHYAVENGYEEIAAFLIQCGADVNAVDKTCKNTPLHYAAIDGHEGITRLLLNSNANINAADVMGCTPLHRAAHGGHSSTVSCLLSFDADILAEDLMRRIPLLSAVEGGDKETFKIMMSAYKDQVIPRSLYNNLLNEAVLSGHEEIADILIKKGANVNNIGSDGKTPLHLAAMAGNKALIHTLLKNKASVKAKTNVGYSTPVHLAAVAGQFDAVEILLEYNSDINVKDYRGPLLHSAVFGGNKDVVSLLLKHNVEVNILDNEGISPLLLAIEEGHKEIVQLLISSGADTNLQNGKHMSPLLSAVNNHDEEMVKLLIENGAIVQTEANDDTEFCHPLFIAIHNGYRGIVDILLNANISVNMKLSDGNTLLHFAAKQGHKEIVNTLISKGAFIDAETLHYPMTPLGLAIVHGHKEVFETLMANGADINTEGMCNPLLLASERGHDDIVQILLENKAKLYFGKYGEFFPLEMAVYRGNLKVVKMLLQTTQVDVNQKGEKGTSPLHIASEESDLTLLSSVVFFPIRLR